MIHRRAVRALIITGAREVLLLRIRPPHGDCFWIAPGGGSEGDETREATLRRELAEELGLVDFAHEANGLRHEMRDVYRAGSFSNDGLPSGRWWKVCLSQA
ncbi:NUDIX domain-containing protein [Bradyrhizobium tropiciagri]|uniref:NUDIX domain-containing protein n=1 Tax=Bradyrhizobium tropiciagri TaxID=312253 RepID=UPI00067CA34D|nr:NUDIX hydrolase [Bradyrhizobium tropiciagri]